MDRSSTKLFAAMGAAIVAAVIPLAVEPAAAQDAAAGSRVFSQNCAACHMVTGAGRNSVGPNLRGVVGRHSATVPNFNYSPALQHSGITWTPEELQDFIRGPARKVPGTRMAYAGLRNPRDAAAVVAYLNTLQTAEPPH